MADRLYRMAEYHARSGKAHDLTNFLSHHGLVAMHAAIRAEGFTFHKRTLVASLSGVSQKLGTFGTKLFLTVLLFAINFYHKSDRLLFPFALAIYITPDHTCALSLHGRCGLQWTSLILCATLK